MLRESQFFILFLIKPKITFLNSYLIIEFHTFALVFKVSQSILDRFDIDIAPKGLIFK